MTGLLNLLNILNSIGRWMRIIFDCRRSLYNIKINTTDHPKSEEINKYVDRSLMYQDLIIAGLGEYQHMVDQEGSIILILSDAVSMGMDVQNARIQQAVKLT